MTNVATFTREAVPVSGLDRIKTKVRAAERKCLRWDLPAPVLTVSEERLEPDPYWDGGPYATAEDRPLIRVVDVSLTAPESIGIPGWRLLARIDALPDGGHVIIRTPDAEGVALPEVDDPQACDHCGSRRHRKDTFLVEEAASGAIRQVGRNCLADHLGYDPDRLLWWSTFTADLEGLMSDPTPREERLWPTSWLMLTACRLASRKGYMSARKAEELADGDPYRKPRTTRQRLEDHAFHLEKAAKGDPHFVRLVEEFDEEYPDDDGAHRLFAATMDAVYRLTGTEGEWQANIASIVTQSAVRPRHVGIAVSAVVLGLRALEPEPAAKPEVVSEPLGAIGDRLRALPVEVTFVKHFDGQYGTRTLVKMRAEAEQADVIWWASGFLPESMVGEQRLLTGTVKAHEVDRFTRRMATTVTRAKFEEMS